MSLPLTSTDDGAPALTVVTRFVVPVLVAVAVTALVLIAVRAETLDGGAEAAAAPPAPPTPYSEMHARVQQAPGEPEAQPPTF